MENQKQKAIDESLEICRKTANILKEAFPNQVMALKDNTIIECSKKNNRLIHASSKRNGMGNHLAYYTHATPHRIIIKQKFLVERNGWLGANYYSLNPIMEQGDTLHKKYYENENAKHGLSYGPALSGNMALVELVCHELAHHQTKGHGHGFKVKYQRFLQYMINQILSGKFYC